MSAITFALPPLASIKPSSANTALRALRSQAAFLRALLDEVERLAPASPGDEGFSEQIVEELARLGCRLLEAASELTSSATRGTAPKSRGQEPLNDDGEATMAS